MGDMKQPTPKRNAPTKRRNSQGAASTKGSAVSTGSAKGGSASAVTKATTAGKGAVGTKGPAGAKNTASVKGIAAGAKSTAATKGTAAGVARGGKQPLKRKDNPALAKPTTGLSRGNKADHRTKAAKKPQKAPGFPVGSFWKTAQKSAKKKKHRGVGGFFSTLGTFLILMLKALGANFWYLLRTSHVMQVVVVVVVLVGGFAIFDLVNTTGKAYTGVRVGTVDVGGKTAEEIEGLLREAYGAQVGNGSAIIYASDEAKATVDADMAQAQDAAVAQQVAVDEYRANKQAWRVNAEDVGAYVPVEELAQKALAVGREDGGSIARLQALTQGVEIEPDVAFNETFVETLAQDIDATLGTPRVDYGVEVSNGWAYTTPGNDGEMVNREKFTAALAQAFLGNETSFVAHVEPAPLHITEAQAQDVANLINQRIAYGCSFNYKNFTWTATSYDLGTWISVAAIPNASGIWSLRAFVDAEKAKPSLLAHLEEISNEQPATISFAVSDGAVSVKTNEVVPIPLVSKAVPALQEVLFGDTFEATTPIINVEQGEAPSSMSLSEALNLGIVSTISTFKTEFTTGEGTENRNHNIALASQLLNNSVVKPGQTWSFNETSGDCNAEAGFQEAGAIVAGEYVDSVGGGICQVATTVFNAVYESGLPVVSRWNHSLYIASYPSGRDAAVSYPDLDLRWQNDTKSDILLQMQCDNGSVTATLYGVDPDYVVTSETGAWEKGETYRTIEKEDTTLAEGNYYIQTTGADGSAISVTRTVTDQNGNLIRQDVFDSVYDPKDEVIMRGPNTEVPHHEDETNDANNTQVWDSYDTTYTDTAATPTSDTAAVTTQDSNAGSVDTTYNDAASGDTDMGYYDESGQF